MWLFGIGLSVVLTIAALVLVSKKRDKAMWASVSSLVLVIVSLLLEYKMILDWVNKNDWSAMLDVVPTMFEYSVLRVPLIRDRIPSVVQSVPLTY